MRKTYASTPVLRVADVRRSADFFVKVLGYEEPAFFGEPPEFCMAHRGEFDIMLNSAVAPDERLPNGKLEVWDIHLRVADLAAEKAAIEAAGAAASIVCETGPTEYGMIELWVRSPDGHLICLGQDLERRPEDRAR